MNTAVINVKTDPKLKEKAQEIAADLGFSLSSLVNAYLKQLTRTKAVSFSIPEEPSDYLVKAIEEAEEDLKAGRVATFNNPKDAVAWLKNPRGKYGN